MADEKDKPVAQIPVTVNISDCLKKLDAIEAKALENAGKDGHNPYLWIAAKTAPIRKTLADRDSDKSGVVAAIGALKVDTRTDEKVASDLEDSNPDKI